MISTIYRFIQINGLKHSSQTIRGGERTWKRNRFDQRMKENCTVAKPQGAADVLQGSAKYYLNHIFHPQSQTKTKRPKIVTCVSGRKTRETPLL